MKVFLMYRDRDFAAEKGLLRNAADLTQDLGLETLFRTMAAGDQFLLDVAKKALLTPLFDTEAILYRQHILADCLEQAAIVRDLYQIAVEAIEREKKEWGWMSGRSAEGTLHRAIDVLNIFVEQLKKLRRIADEHRGRFCSEGFQRFFTMLAKELDDEYLGGVEGHLRQLRFHNGLLMSAELGKGLKGENYILRKPPHLERSWIERLQGWLGQLSGKKGSSYVYEIADRDEAGFRALRELTAQGIAHVAAALAQSTDHILAFFNMLRLELGFYVSCLNMRDRLASKGEPICLPEPLPGDVLILSGSGLFDASLSLNMEQKVVGNDVAADGKVLVIITGANQGGKSTFLRSVGLAQLMMQCGMFVAAESLRANVCAGIFTHFKREEDADLKSGKLDEELVRMSSIIDGIAPNSIVLFNESFASTNEREGAEIARQIIRALLESGVKMLYVTHMFDLAQGFFLKKMDRSLFLRAERLADGRRTFRVIEGEPLPTSYGEDLYHRIFESDGHPVSSEL
jgi:hypothetical protein